MKKYQEVVGKAKILYYVFGDKPRLLIDSGTHGDEWEVVGSVERTIKKYIDDLSDFIYIPEISPSAVKQRTRENEDGLDINRSFFDDAKDEEVRAVIKVLSRYHFDLSVSFHEYGAESDFYFYDSNNMEGSRVLNDLRKGMKEIGVGLYSGVDDDNDSVLNFKLKDGYAALDEEQNKENNGRVWNWLYRKGIVERIVLPEVPGGCKVEMKDKIVDVFFKSVVLGLMEK